VAGSLRAPEAWSWTWSKFRNF